MGRDRTVYSQSPPWLSGFLDLFAGIPSHDTFGRVFAALNPAAFQKCLPAWTQRLHAVTAGQVIAIDGKVAREAMARAGDQGPMTLVSAWATANHHDLKRGNRRRVLTDKPLTRIGRHEMGAGKAAAPSRVHDSRWPRSRLCRLPGC